MSGLSKEYVSDSEFEDNEEVDQVFRAPSNYKKCKHLKKFNKKPEEQIWLIKLPASLDVSKLKSLPVDFDAKGHGSSLVALDEGNKKYSITEEDGLDNSNLTVLVPDESRESLRVSNSKGETVSLDRVFTVSEVAAIPGIDFDKLRVPRSNVVKVEGLKMRHFPTGYDANDYGVSEEKKVKKRKEEEAVASSSSPSKKHKKDKKKRDRKK